MVRKSWRLAVLLLAGWPAPARAEAPAIAVTCPSWPTETASQVEARIRAALLVETVQVQRVAVVCASDGSISVQVESTQGALARPVPTRSALVEDDVVAATEAALRELRTPTEPPSATPEAPPPSAPPPSAVAAPPPAPARPPPAPTRPAPQPQARSTAIEASATAEPWGDDPALGGSVGLLVGSARLQYGLSFGARAALGEPASFEVHELDVSGHLALTLPGLLGLRLALGAGPSLLLASPARGVTPDSATSLAAAGLELKLERPFWVGAWGIAPGAAVRLFSASRNVRVDEREELVLPVFVPRASVSISYRLP